MKLDTRQKVLIPLIIVAFGYVLFQLYDMFGDSVFHKTHSYTTVSSSTATPSPDKTSAAPTQATQTPTIVKTPISPTTVTPAATTTSPVMHPVPNQLPSTVKPEQPHEQTSMTTDQSEYVNLVNKYQTMKLRRLLVEEEAAIATAENKISKLHHDNNKGDDELSVSNTGSIPHTKAIVGYRLMYLDNQAGTWSATINLNNHLYEVKNGTMLPNNTRVTNINNKGVTLHQYNQRSLLTFSGMETLPMVSTAKNSAKAPVIQRHRLGHIAPEQKTVVKPLSAKIKPLVTVKPTPLHINAKQVKAHKPKAAIVKLQKHHSAISTAIAASEAFLLKQQSSYYTIQIMGSRKPAALEALIKQRHLKHSKNWIFHTYFLNKDWYVLVNGIYKTKNDASMQIKALTKHMKGLSPWVRSIASVQQAIKIKH